MLLIGEASQIKIDPICAEVVHCPDAVGAAAAFQNHSISHRSAQGFKGRLGIKSRQGCAHGHGFTNGLKRELGIAVGIFKTSLHHLHIESFTVQIPALTTATETGFVVG